MEFTKLCGESVQKFPAKKAIILRMMIAQLQGLLDIHTKTRKYRLKIEQKIFELTSTSTILEAKQILHTWLSLLNEEEKSLEKNAQKSKVKLETGFEDLVVETTKYLGFQIDRRKTTVAEFAEHVKSFKRHIANIEKNNQKNIRKKG